METPLSVLKRYWNHEQFRPLQADIIDSVLQGNDTLALLPTGGGKSVCFQVPALVMPGLCIVVTPLIALMKDQVEQLKKKGIIAVAIHSGMSRREIDILLDNCIYGPVKFLYVSPERLQTEIFVERVRKMNVTLIAVDEAHCISQWGYDFRPPYLKITSLRELKPGVPVIALTASATTQVQADIMEKLAFGKKQKHFHKSFARDNLSFVVRMTENKEKQLLNILAKVKGSAILYVRSRKATQDIATWLTKRSISASYYHAGLEFDDRSKRQDEWIQNKTRVMVATNAFGMGIDKPDVRVVIHLDLPENLEAYYQEAGRAGRDGKRCYAVILYQEADLINLKRKVEQSHPEPDALRKLYQCLANYFQLAEGSAEGQSYDFDLTNFAERFQLNQSDAFSGLKKLEEEGLIHFNESYYSPSHLHLLLDKAKLYEFQIANAKFDPVIKMLLRLYGGEMISDFVKINENYLARSLNIKPEQMVAILTHLNDVGVVAYEPRKDKPQVTFLTARYDASKLPLNVKRLKDRKDLVLEKMNAMHDYTSQQERCRMLFIQHYFGEKTLATCGICDVCLARRKRENHSDFESMRKEIVTIVKQKLLTIEEIEEIINPKDNSLFIDVIRDLVDEGIIEYDAGWQLKISTDPAG
jgi:ATP-dependent DNA helicase RecQ